MALYVETLKRVSHVIMSSSSQLIIPSSYSMQITSKVDTVPLNSTGIHIVVCLIGVFSNTDKGKKV